MLTISKEKRNKEEVFQIEPNKELYFKGPYSSGSICKLNVTNVTDQLLLFKVRTTQVQRYTVRPTHGKVAARSTETIVITLQPVSDLSDLVLDHKFALLLTLLESIPVEFDISAFWSEYQESQISKIAIYQHKLQCRFDVVHNGRAPVVGEDGGKELTAKSKRFMSKQQQQQPTSLKKQMPLLSKSKSERVYLTDLIVEEKSESVSASGGVNPSENSDKTKTTPEATESGRFWSLPLSYIQQQIPPITETNKQNSQCIPNAIQPEMSPSQPPPQHPPTELDENASLAPVVLLEPPPPINQIAADIIKFQQLEKQQQKQMEKQQQQQEKKQQQMAAAPQSCAIIPLITNSQNSLNKNVTSTNSVEKRLKQTSTTTATAIEEKKSTPEKTSGSSKKSKLNKNNREEVNTNFPKVILDGILLPEEPPRLIYIVVLMFFILVVSTLITQ